MIEKTLARLVMCLLSPLLFLSCLHLIIIFWVYIGKGPVVWFTSDVYLVDAVTVRDLFYNQPVRQKYMQSRFISYTLRHPHSSSPRLKFCERCPCFYVKSFLSFSFCNGSPKKVLESITKCVFRIALVHSNVSFSVLDIDRWVPTFILRSLWVQRPFW